MPYGLYISAAGADAQSKRLEVLSNNLANVNTPGFKRELAILQSRHAEAIERGLEPAGQGQIEDVGGGVQFAETVTDFSAGNLQQTGNDTDLAIDGEGFFLVEKDGKQALTRAGNFHFSPTGQLQTEQGYPVLSAEGEPVAVEPNIPWRALEDGSVEQAGNKTFLALVKPPSRGDLVKVGKNVFSPLGEVNPIPAGERHVLNGYLEQSTVQSTTEMMELIETSRIYEANVQLIQHHDHMIGSLVNRVLRQ